MDDDTDLTLQGQDKKQQLQQSQRNDSGVQSMDSQRDNMDDTTGVESE